MIIDCHTHLNRYTPDLPPTLRERHALLRAVMEGNGIEYALVLTSYDVTPDRPGVEEVLEQVEDDPRLGVVAGMSLERLAVRHLSRIRDLLEEGRLRGLKLYPGYETFYLHEDRLRPIYEMARHFGVPVMIHTGDTYNPRVQVKYAHPLHVDEVAVEWPEVTFLMSHLGNPWFADAMEVIYKNANVVGDICGLTVGPFAPRFERWALGQVNAVVAYVNDPRKLLFGTDWPISEVASYVDFAHKLELSREETEGLMWRNAARVFRLEVGEEAEGDGGEAR